MKTTTDSDRLARFEERVKRCPAEIAEAFRTLRKAVEDWPEITIGIDSKIDGYTFYRERPGTRRRAFFRLDPKHSAGTPNMGVAFFGLTPDRIEKVATPVKVRRHLKQPGDWIFVHDKRNNSALIELAREAYDNA